jgi:lipoprotein-anchoring transpeptidase ErfK/SrfK
MLSAARLLPIFLILFLAAFFLNPFHKNINQTESSIATTSCCKLEDVINSKGDFDEGAVSAVFNNEAVFYPKKDLAEIANNSQTTVVLGAETNEATEKWIEVSLDEQKLRAMEGDKVVREFQISSGRWFPTPTGTYNIWYKTRFQKMEGGSKEFGTYYNLPNVPYNMFFHDGFALHGAYWHYNFGHPMSHGCVNEPLADAAWLFDWAGPKVPEGQNWVRATDDNPGTKVVIR